MILDNEAELAQQLRQLVNSVESLLSPPSVPCEEIFRRGRRLRSRRRFGLVTGIALIVAIAAITVGLTSETTTSAHHSVATPKARPKAVPVLDVEPSINMDILSKQVQVSLNLASGDVTRSAAVVMSASVGSGVAIGIQRQGYIVGLAADSDNYISVTDDLQTVLHTWTGRFGQYGAPASNPSNLWISDPYSTPSTATEVNGNEVPVGPTVPIPRGTIVAAQDGSDLILEDNGNGPETLEIWDPAARRVVVNYGSYGSVASSSSQFAWTSSGNILHIVNDGETAGKTVVGPDGDWLTDLVFSPDGSKIAIIWAPVPGSPRAYTSGQIDSYSEVQIVNGSSGAASMVPDSSGVTGPIAWMPDGSRIFFGQIVRRAGSLAGSARPLTIATFALRGSSSQQLILSGVVLPSYFSPVTSGLVVWSK
jgi:hypothetical protein